MKELSLLLRALIISFLLVRFDSALRPASLFVFASAFPISASLEF